MSRLVIPLGLCLLAGCGGHVDPPPIVITCPPYCITPPTNHASTSQALGGIGQKVSVGQPGSFSEGFSTDFE